VPPGAATGPGAGISAACPAAARPFLGRAAPTASAVAEHNGALMLRPQALRGALVHDAGRPCARQLRNFFTATARRRFSGVRLAQDA